MDKVSAVSELSRKSEDYLEAILNVTLEKGYARTKDVACELGVKSPSVVEMFRKLSALGLVEYRKYEGVVFKPVGRKIAETIKYRHDLLKQFFRMINVPEEIADNDACLMEHELHQDTVEQLRYFVDFLDGYVDQKDFSNSFSEYCKNRRKNEKQG